MSLTYAVSYSSLKIICLPQVKPFLTHRSALEVVVSVQGPVILPKTARDHPRYRGAPCTLGRMRSSGCRSWWTVLSLRDNAAHADCKKDCPHKMETGKDIKVSGALLVLLTLMFCLEPLDFSWAALTAARRLDLPYLICFWTEVELVTNIRCIGSVVQPRAP